MFNNANLHSFSPIYLRENRMVTNAAIMLALLMVMVTVNLLIATFEVLKGESLSSICPYLTFYIQPAITSFDGRKMNAKRELIIQTLKSTPTMRYKNISNKLGVTVGYITKVAHEARKTGELPMKRFGASRHSKIIKYLGKEVGRRDKI